MTTTLHEHRAGRRGRAGTPAAVLVCVALAVLSLPLPAALGFDPWAWLVWGREVASLDLDTTGGPSWKPFPVLLVAPMSPLGAGAAEVALTIVVRAGSLLALVAAYRLARRFAGPAAGIVAAALLPFTPDGDPRFLRLVAEGHVAPLSITASLFAVEAHLDRRPGRTLLLGWVVAMIRPEAWPLLLAYGGWRWQAEPERRRQVVAALLSLPLLWFLPDWLGSGDPLHGADAAQVSAALSPLERLADALLVALAMVPAPAWVAAAGALIWARRTGQRVLGVVAGGALAWSALVVVMAAALGYAALSRFHLPAAGVACVLAGIGTARIGQRIRETSRRPRLLGAALVALSLVASAPRIVGVVPVLEEVADRGALEDDLDRLLDQAGSRPVLASCGEVAVAGTGLLRSAVAWKLDLPLHRVPVDLSDGSGVLVLPATSSRRATLEPLPVVEPVAVTDRWVALAIRCPSAVPDV